MQRNLTRIAGIAGLAALGWLGWLEAANAQDLHPSRRPSPLGIARTTLEDGTYVRVIYGRPYQRGRDNIFGTRDSGALVPFGEVWRTGANEASEITVTRDVLIGGQRLPAGTYSLFTTPGPQEWQVHFNRELGLSGTARFNPATERFEPAYDAANNALTVTVRPTTLESPVDQLTFSFEPADGGPDLTLRWITTEVRVPVRVAEAPEG